MKQDDAIPGGHEEDFQSRPELPFVTGTTRVFLIRHAEVDDEWKGRIYGQLDAPLSPPGMRMSDALVYRLRTFPFRAVYSSDLERTVYTGRSLVRLFNMPHTRDARLRERHYGAWQGLEWDEVRDKHPEELARFDADRTIAPPEGESFAAVRQRAMAFVDELLARHAGDHVVVVTDAEIIRAIICDALELPPRKAFSFQLKQCSVSVLDYRDVDSSGRADAYVALLNG